jgi:protease PrsW
VPPAPWVLLAGAAFAASSLAWAAYFRWKDRHRPEPWPLLLMMLGGGGVAALLSLLGFEGLDALGVGTAWEDVGAASLRRSVSAALRIGAVEEAAKLLPVVLLALTHAHFDELLDGIVYAACAGLGFAAAEGLLLFRGGELSALEATARALAAPVTHALFTAPAGLGLALALLRRRPAALLLGLAASVTAHALYDWLLAQPSLPQGSSAGVVLVLWVWLLAAAPRLARLAPERRGSAAA